MVIIFYEVKDMSIWKYTISLQFIPPNEDPVDIPPENIRKLFKDNTYDDKNMATMYLTLNVDKNLFDKIVLNARNAYMHLTVMKFDEEQEYTTYDMVYDDDCEYFIQDDINYNKEVDYMGENADRQDIYREVYIGLMFKSCIEYNKETSNTTIKETTMFNAVYEFLQDKPALIEPFEYNDTIDQLVVPPQDSLSKTIKFFNDVKVFYSTNYRFYIEPDCIYLTSTSGKSTPKDSDLYETVRIIVHALDDNQAYAQGMYVNDTDQCYDIDMGVNDTVYNMDTDTVKMYGNITSIIDPSIDHSVALQNSLQALSDSLSNIAGTINSAVGDVIGTIQTVPNTLNAMVSRIKKATMASDEAIPRIKEYINEAIGKIRAKDGVMDEETGLTIKIDPKVYSDLEGYIDLIDEYYGSITNTSGTLKDRIPTVMNVLGDATTTMPGYVNGVTPANMQQNENGIIDTESQMEQKSSHIDNDCKAVIIPIVGKGNNLVDTIISAANRISGTNIEGIDGLVTSILTENKTVSMAVSVITNGISEYKKIPATVQEVTDKFKTCASNLQKIPMNLKDQFTQLKSIVNTVGHDAQSLLKEISDRSAKSIQRLKEDGINPTSIKQLRTDINAIKDLTNIGMSGLSNFHVNLSLGRSDNNSTLLYRVNNDNANMAKNLKASIENNQDIITINKSGLDVTVLNPNLEYIVRNYDAHSNKDGIVCLKRKLEIYIRQDDTFVCNCNITLNKIKSNENDKTTVDKATSEEE